ncbi:uncharacterized protein LOC141613547 [Silene latifolia]|uniref:uncharacterized protein LOC141613547 n=1 Tax=Silene latifolia TaxID=37657 RepID=UPI003D77958B
MAGLDVEVPNNEKESKNLIDTGHLFNIPAKFYDSRLQMIDEIKPLGLLHNIHIRVWQHFSKRGFGEQMLRCTHSGDFRLHKKSIVPSKRSYTGTIKCQCPFSLKCVKQNDGRWEVLVLNGYHNHNLAKKTRGLYAKTKEDIVRMTASKISVSNILIDLGTKGINVNAKQVYNVHAISKKQTIPIVTQKGTHELTDVLFAYPNSLKLLKAYPYVLIADCTYNTNKYKMSMLKVIGVTPVHKNFSVFFAFLQNERETAYDWAFECLTELLDSNEPIVFVTDRETALMTVIQTHFLSASLLLCRRHIQKDVEAWVKRNYYGNALVGEVFAKGKWTQMVRSTTLEEFKENEELMYRTYSYIPGLEKYCKETWLDKYKERFVSAWTNKILHFGNVTTNRVESAHAALKRLLRTSVGGFDTVTKHKTVATSFLVDMPDLNIPYVTSPPQEIEHTSLFLYSDDIPHFIVPWINDWVNVVGDENSGYRAVAQEIYGDENKWPRVRHDMFDELKKNIHIYIQIYGSEIEVDELIKRVSWWKGAARPPYWMVTDMGFIIANCYDAIFTYVSSTQSQTTLPVTQRSAMSEGPK